jgi:hypothetical protein
MFRRPGRVLGLRKAPTVVVVAIAALALLAAESPVGYAAPASGPSAPVSQGSAFDLASPATWDGIAVPGTLVPDPTPSQPAAATSQPAAATSQPAAATSQPAGPTFRPIRVLTPATAPKGETVDPSGPLPVQPNDWLALKAAGRIALVDGKITVLAAGSDPLADQSTGLGVPDKKTLDVSWTRWVIEVPGIGRDEKGTYYRNMNYWELCGAGAMTVGLWYWQQLTGHPDVTGTAGYFLDPYVAQGTWWPIPGPKVALSGRTRLGTYWSGSDKIGGTRAHGRGFEMYLAMAAKPATWQSPGFAVFATDGKPLYPTGGTDRSNIQAGLNWEVSGHDPKGWGTAYYASVLGSDPSLSHDLNAAVMLDVGRDGVPVVAAANTYYLPNWQNRAATPSMDHSITIVGYDNKANPPTYTYVDTCGHSCNQRPGNHDGAVHVIAQSLMVLALRYRAGSGFVW